ncbi:Mit_KHE1 domain-containing protein [Cephalotus follicularis]|uniref:Mit_KHE1 domain-containing protein n=1 Tax=Cephalotus follicularis TaxID=3775 RepID=A0A1Q3D4S5_CEPFO|nr:Mit_KHE1 domain-containing protein [Cephalotus follicularis]
MMRARLVVFPIRGRNWCFSGSIDHSASSESTSAFTLKDLWKTISANAKSNPNPLNANAELLIDFVSNKMNKAWIGLEKAPEGSLKNKLHGLGLRLLTRVKPSELFLKSISKEVTNVQVTYPSSLDARLVRRRLRHIALRGTIIHKKYFYGSVSLLPLTSALSVLPLPNVPFFWVLFRTYSHWRALKGSEKLLQLVSDCPQTQNPGVPNVKGSETKQDNSPWVLQPSKELEELIRRGGNDGLSKCVVSDICKAFGLNVNDVLKYRNSLY